MSLFGFGKNKPTQDGQPDNKLPEGYEKFTNGVDSPFIRGFLIGFSTAVKGGLVFNIPKTFPPNPNEDFIKGYIQGIECAFLATIRDKTSGWGGYELTEAFCLLLEYLTKIK